MKLKPLIAVAFLLPATFVGIKKPPLGGFLL